MNSRAFLYKNVHKANQSCMKPKDQEETAWDWGCQTTFFYDKYIYSPMPCIHASR